MNTTLPPWATRVLSVVGAVLLVSLVLDWVSVGDEHVRGLTIAWDEKHWLFLVPISGALLLAMSATRSHYTRMAAVGAGVLVAGDLVYEMMWGMMRGGAESWLLFGGAAVMIAGMSEKRRMLRAIGGIAVLAGFFAPWDSESLFSAMRQGADVMAVFGLSAKILWAVPIAGVLGIASTVVTGVSGSRLAVFAGVAVFGSVLWFLGSIANMFVAWGAWATLGASSIALVIGILAPRTVATPALAKK